MSYTEEQYLEYSNRMKEKFPEIFAGRYGGFSIGPGWWPIVEALCGQIDAYTSWRNNTREALLKDNPHNHKIPNEVPQVVAQQIKEKFGGLRFYYTGGDEHISGMVRMAESWAHRSCEECGKPGNQRAGGWIKTLCDEHHTEREEGYNQQAKKDGLEL